MGSVGVGGCAVDEMTVDGPVELQVRMAEDIDPGQVRIGLFEAWGPAQVVRDSGRTSESEWGLDVPFVPDDSIGLREPTVDDRTISFTPVTMAELELSGLEGRAVLSFPDSMEPGDDHRVVIWIDADDDGRLGLRNDPDAGERGLIPSRAFDDGSRSLTAVRRRHPDNVRRGEGSYRVEMSPLGFSLSTTMARQSELQGWTVEMTAPESGVVPPPG